MGSADIETTIAQEAGGNYEAIIKLFPKHLQEDVMRLYSFVLTANAYVNGQPQRSAEFLALCRGWDLAKIDPKFDTKRSASDTPDERVIKNIIYITHTYKLDPAWVEAFLAAMQEDADHKAYKSLDETLVYVYGAAEVVCLMLSKVLGFPDEALPYARLQGRATKWISFLRDIDSNNARGRQYFPSSDLVLYHLANLNQETALGSRELFGEFTRMQLGHYNDWQLQANEGYKYIPNDLQKAVRTVAELYAWTARQIEKNPLKIYDKKIVPNKQQLATATARAVHK